MKTWEEKLREILANKKKVVLAAKIEEFYNKAHQQHGEDGGQFVEGPDGPGRKGVEGKQDLGKKGINDPNQKEIKKKSVPAVKDTPAPTTAAAAPAKPRVLTPAHKLGTGLTGDDKGDLVQNLGSYDRLVSQGQWSEAQRREAMEKKLAESKGDLLSAWQEAYTERYPNEKQFVKEKKSAGGFESDKTVRRQGAGSAEAKSAVNTGKEYIEGLPKRLTDDLEAYATGGSAVVNPCIIKGCKNKVYQEIAKHTQEAVDNAPSFDPVIAYRGIRLIGKTPEEVAVHVADNYKPGATIKIGEGMQSTSVDPGVGLHHSIGSKGDQGDGIVFEVKANKGLYIDHLNPFGEKEIIISDKSDFTVLAVKKNVPFETADGKIILRTVVQVEQN